MDDRTYPFGVRVRAVRAGWGRERSFAVAVVKTWKFVDSALAWFRERIGQRIREPAWFGAPERLA